MPTATSRRASSLLTLALITAALPAAAAEVATLADRYAAAVEEISALSGVRTVVVLEAGEVVVAEGFAGGDPARPHNLKSASKSLLSTLVGIAVESGDLPGLDATLGELLAEQTPEEKKKITLRHLLTQTTGLESTSGAQYGAWVSTSDWTRAALERPLVAEPGAEFRYSTGNTHLVAAVLERATGEDLLTYARRVLLDPLGFGEVTWESSPEGVRLGGNQMSMSPTDFAKFGWMVARGGVHGERRLVPEAYLAAATGKQVATPEEWATRYGDYGYLWWIPRGHAGAYAAVGYGGQVLYVVPEERRVVVVTSTLEGKGAAWDRKLFGILKERFSEEERM